MLRLYDFRCTAGHTFEATVDVPSGSRPRHRYRILCLACGARVLATRLLSAPAKYLGDRPLNVSISGGSYDTMGYRRLPELPEFPDNGHADEFRDFVRTPEYVEAKRQRARVAEENKAKRKRARAMKRGETVSMRHQRLPGDPDFR